MKNFILILFVVLAFYSCADKPPAGKVNRSHRSQYVTKKNTKKQIIPSVDPSQNESITEQINDVITPEKMYENLSPAVFKIEIYMNEAMGSQGSGFLISNDGLALSNYHVFEGGIRGTERITFEDGGVYKVSEIYYKDSTHDFIIFRIANLNNTKYIKLASASPKVGQKIYTIGSPLGLDNTFTTGEISQIRMKGDLLQISAPIDHGSSGGVLLNTKGEAIGITTSGIDGSNANLNFAININLIKPYIKSIQERRSF